ncbi:MAG: hypothetical protein D6732_24095, partial [Methanobacteriota archaeon]
MMKFGIPGQGYYIFSVSQKGKNHVPDNVDWVVFYRMVDGTIIIWGKHKPHVYKPTRSCFKFPNHVPTHAYRFLLSETRFFASNREQGF